jgi:hypothetical protein
MRVYNIHEEAGNKQMFRLENEGKIVSKPDGVGGCICGEKSG